MENNGREECFYNGHRICVEAEEVAGGAWNWRYVVVGELIASKSGTMSLPDAEAALKDGMTAAQELVNALRGSSLTLLGRSAPR